MPEDRFRPLPGSMGDERLFGASVLPMNDIPEEDWQRARALTRYPPHIILWMIRTVLDEQRSVEPRDGALNREPPANLPHDESVVTDQPPISKTNGPKRQQTQWFCVFDEHRDKSFGKRSDWKKHMNGFHEPGKKAWRCDVKDCFRVFEKASNFRQHHRIEHGCRKSCKHAESAKRPTQVKQAFACGRESCQALLFSWDRWLEHIAQHIEDGMTVSQWQYNTLFRNLLRRPEIHPVWEQFVAAQVHPFNISARFTWRPRNTGSLKRQLEYKSHSELLNNADQLVLKAFEAGTAVRSAQELSDPSALITEPTVMPRQPSFGPSNVPQPHGPSSDVGGGGHSGVGISPSLLHQGPRGYQPLVQHLPSALTPAATGLDVNLYDEQVLSFGLLQIDRPTFSPPGSSQYG